MNFFFKLCLVLMNFDPTMAEDRIVLKYKGVASVMEILCYTLGTLGSPRGPGGPGSGPNSSPKPKNFWDLDIKTQFFVEIMVDYWKTWTRESQDPNGC